MKPACAMRLPALGSDTSANTCVPVIYRGYAVDCDLAIDLVVEHSLLAEIKSVQQILPVHEARLLTYLRVSGLKMGPLLNINEETLKQAVRRRVL